jgi:hypothetical protein
MKNSRLFSQQTNSLENITDSIYKTTLQSWVKLYKNFNFRNKVQFTPETKITIGKNIYIAKLFNTDLDAKKQPIMYFKPINCKNKSILNIPTGKFKEIEFIIDFTSDITPDLIRYFTPPQIELPKANTICETICFPYIPQLQPNNGFIYNGVYLEDIPTYNGIISLRSQPYLKDNYLVKSTASYNGVEIKKPTRQEKLAKTTKENLYLMQNYGKFLIQTGKVTL